MSAGGTAAEEAIGRLSTNARAESSYGHLSLHRCFKTVFEYDGRLAVLKLKEPLSILSILFKGLARKQPDDLTRSGRSPIARGFALHGFKDPGNGRLFEVGEIHRD